MNKERFLAELREYLSVLENQEQDDILEEYAQHIDMKMKKGLSEEEAIRDFGSIEQLAVEILEAYHVNPDFRGKRASFRVPQSRLGVTRNFVGAKKNFSSGVSDLNGTNAKDNFWKKAGRQIKGMWTRGVHAIGNAFRWLGAKCRAFARWCSKPFTRRKSEDEVDTQEKRIERRGTEEMSGRIGKFFGTIGRGIVSLWRWLVRLCIFCLKFMWNAAWLIFTIFCGCMAMIALMGVGAIMIFLTQDYPLLGILLIFIGGLLCFGSLAYGAFSMLIRRPKDDKSQIGEEGKQERAKEEAAYEQTA